MHEILICVLEQSHNRAYRASNWDLEAPASEEPKIPSLFKSQRRVEPYDVVVRVLMI
jgi:hypothetical protein